MDVFITQCPDVCTNKPKLFLVVAATFFVSVKSDGRITLLTAVLVLNLNTLVEHWLDFGEV